MIRLRLWDFSKNTAGLCTKLKQEAQNPLSIIADGHVEPLTEVLNAHFLQYKCVIFFL